MSVQDDQEEVGPDHIIGEFQRKVGRDFSRNVAPWEARVARKIPRLYHVRVFVVEYAVISSAD
jgi:hypothetical protein